MAWLSGILAGLQTINEIINGLKAVSAFIQENKNEQWFKDSATTFSGLISAKTPEERRAAAKNIRDLLGGLS